MSCRCRQCNEAEEATGPTDWRKPMVCIQRGLRRPLKLSFACFPHLNSLGTTRNVKAARDGSILNGGEPVIPLNEAASRTRRKGNSNRTHFVPQRPHTVDYVLLHPGATCAEHLIFNSIHDTRPQPAITHDTTAAVRDNAKSLTLPSAEFGNESTRGSYPTAAAVEEESPVEPASQVPGTYID